MKNSRPLGRWWWSWRGLLSDCLVKVVEEKLLSSRMLSTSSVRSSKRVRLASLMAGSVSKPPTLVDTSGEEYDPPAVSASKTFKVGISASHLLLAARTYHVCLRGPVASFPLQGAFSKGPVVLARSWKFYFHGQGWRPVAVISAELWTEIEKTPAVTWGKWTRS